MAELRVGLIGAGSMGANHARVIAASTRARLAVVVDADPERAGALAHGAGARTSTGVEDVLGCDAVVVASATESHPEIAATLLDAGVPVLVEKPLASDLADVERMVKSSDAVGVPLMCGFVERFNPVIATVREMIDSPPVHIVGMRHSPHTPRATSSVVHDLLIHDIDLAMHVSDDYGAAVVSGCTWTPAGTTTAEIADCTMRFGSGWMATLSASRAGQRKVRTLQVTTEQALYDVDLLRQDLSVYRHVSQSQVEAGPTTYRSVTVVDVPFVRYGGEPLALQLAHFLDLVEGKADAEAERERLLPPHRSARDVELYR